jgi:glycosyltransferase involved in cell wall biosynthesis
VEGADLVLVSSRALPAALPAPKAAPITLPNAADTRHFKPTGPESGSVASLPRPRVGYVGAIDERAFDATLIAAAAGRRPDWAFVLAGPVTRHARSTLKHLSNVHLLGPVDYEDVPALIRGFDVCLIPYRRGGLVDYVQPKKLYEYLAAGKPVVATDLRGLEGLEAPLRRVTTAEEFVVAVEASLDESRPDLVRRRRACAESNTWDQRGELLRRLVGQLETSVV